MPDENTQAEQAAEVQSAPAAAREARGARGETGRQSRESEQRVFTVLHHVLRDGVMLDPEHEDTITFRDDEFRSGHVQEMVDNGIVMEGTGKEARDARERAVRERARLRAEVAAGPGMIDRVMASPEPVEQDENA